ncbi:UNVERIFIED_CONTAM: Ubiquinone biosynthesis monooxygenase COQ6, mitochondrial, partial [Sesamum indicum]
VELSSPAIWCLVKVGADGSKSRVKDLAGINPTGWKYSQNAIICTVEHMEENHCAWQCFLPNGPIALLPIGENFSNIVWTMTPEESLNRKSMSEVDFVREIDPAFSWLTGDTIVSANECFEVPPRVTKVASERMVFPLYLNHGTSYALTRVVLIGDAAHTVHPLAGQGVIAEGIAVGSDIGEDMNIYLNHERSVVAQVSLLREYESDRRPANLTMMAILDGFQKAYSLDFRPLNVLRTAAFQGAHYISPL